MADDAKPASAPSERPALPKILGVGRGSRVAEPTLEIRALPASITGILAAGGIVLLLVAWTHLLVMFIPPHFGIAAWEFTAASQAVDVMPLAIAGIALLSCAAVAAGWRRRVFIVVGLCVITALVQLALAGLVLLDLPIAWRSVTVPMQQDLAKTAAKSMGFAVVFAVFHIWLSARLISAARAARIGSR